MITTFQKFKLITESPDKIKFVDDDGWADSYNWQDHGTKPFYCIVNSDHTKVERLYVGDFGNTHDEINFINKDHKTERKKLVSYPGRVWLREKIMSFWVFPNEKLFVSIIKNLEKRLRRKIFKNGWRIEVVKSDNEIERTKFDPSNDDNLQYYGDHDIGYKTEIIPLDDYVGSENPPEEERIMHMMNWREKVLAKKAGKLNIKGWGSDKTAWDSPHNIEFRQKIYQEKKNNDDY